MIWRPDFEMIINIFTINGVEPYYYLFAVSSAIC